MSVSGDQRNENFQGLYDAHFNAVLGYALRRTARPEDAADVVSETFLVAWRRLAHLPPDDAAGFVGEKSGQSGTPDEFAVRLREVLASA